MRRIDLSLFLTALFALLLLPEYATAQSSPITLGLTTRNGSNSLPYVIAEEKGFFKAEGIKRHHRRSCRTKSSSTAW